jgi:hypothetical protein
MFSQVTGLDEQQVLGQIESAPPSDFLPLLTLDASGYGSLWPKLAKVPGMTYQKQNQRLFDSSAQEVVGQVGTENSSVLREEGAAYQPGMTVGLTGFEQAFQTDLLGTPTTSVVVVNAAGHSVATLWSSPGGRAGTPVQTTLNTQQQSAAVNALARAGNSAEIVALDWGSGQIRVLASHVADPDSAAARQRGTGLRYRRVLAAAAAGVLRHGPDGVRRGECGRAGDRHRRRADEPARHGDRGGRGRGGRRALPRAPADRHARHLAGAAGRDAAR